MVRFDWYWSTGGYSGDRTMQLVFFVLLLAAVLLPEAVLIADPNLP